MLKFVKILTHLLKYCLSGISMPALLKLRGCPSAQLSLELIICFRREKVAEVVVVGDIAQDLTHWLPIPADTE